MQADAPDARATRIDEHAERATLGELLLDARAMPAVAALLEPADFADLKRGQVFAATLAVWKRGVPVGATTVADELVAEHRWQLLDAHRFLTALSDEAVGSTVGAEANAAIVHNEAVARSAIAAAYAVLHAATREHARADALVELLGEQTRTVSGRLVRSAAKSYGEFADQFLSEYLERAESGAAYAGVPFGWPSLDELTGSMLPGELIVVAADTGHGKSALALATALNVALLAPAKGGGPVLMYSLEMKGKEIAGRGISQTARVDLSKFRRLSATTEDLTHLSRVAGAAVEVPLYINDSTRITLEKIRAEAMVLRNRFGRLALLVVDYCQLLAKALKRANPKIAEHEAINDVSSELKMLAGEVDCPIILLSQYNRGFAQRTLKEKDAKASVHDLKGSSGIGQDGNTVLLMTTDNDAGFADITAAKQRGDVKGKSVRLKWYPTQTRFEELDAPASWDGAAAEDDTYGFGGVSDAAE